MKNRISLFPLLNGVCLIFIGTTLMLDLWSSQFSILTIISILYLICGIAVLVFVKHKKKIVLIGSILNVIYGVGTVFDTMSGAVFWFLYAPISMLFGTIDVLMNRKKRVSLPVAIINILSIFALLSCFFIPFVDSVISIVDLQSAVLIISGVSLIVGSILCPLPSKETVSEQNQA